ncbi:MAG: DUF2807 domain-containing protein [Bacteroidales bacterium]|nr:DUF2807 domain-containing protein [Bacteroidales bacterium]
MDKLRVIFGLLIIILASCEDSLYSDGDKTRKEVSLDYFYRLDINEIFDVSLLSDTINAIEIFAGENIIDLISADVVDSVLRLSYNNKWGFVHPTRKIKLTVHHTNLVTININEPSFVRTLNPLTGYVGIAVPAREAEIDVELDCYHFLFYTHQSTFGEYTFRGAAGFAVFLGYKASIIHADSLIAREIYIEHFSIGNFYVNATESLTVKLFNTGNVYYRGEPEIINEERNAEGRLIKLEDY